MTDDLSSEQASYSDDSSEERTWGMLCHVASFAGFLVPFGGVVGPLVVWLVKKDEYAFVDDQGKEALNFQITVLILLLACIPLIFIVIGIFLMIAIAVADVVLTIIALIQANAGVAYRYPFNFRFVK